MTIPPYCPTVDVEDDRTGLSVGNPAPGPGRQPVSHSGQVAGNCQPQRLLPGSGVYGARSHDAALAQLLP